ncbi:Pentapeptide repeats (9 copies) [Novymonas esmeraldas]|uniref:Pentapeptide repeats (9 copies) n=1 Tax=Novymonas esmeraldas TaxID=1808958 RepID=A0AAW0F4K2_9TRYP
MWCRGGAAVSCRCRSAVTTAVAHRLYHVLPQDTRTRAEEQVHVRHHASTRHRHRHRHRRHPLPPDAYASHNSRAVEESRGTSSPDTGGRRGGSRAAHPTRRADPARASPALDGLKWLDVALAVSSALYHDEASATATGVDGRDDVRDDRRRSAASPHGAPDGDAASAATAADGPLEDAYASVAAADLMATMDSSCAGATEHYSLDARDGAPSPRCVDAAEACVTVPGASSSSIVSSLVAPDVPLEETLLRMLDLCSSHSHNHRGRRGAKHGAVARADAGAAAAEAAPSSAAAAALMLPGLDVKAVLTRGVLEHRHLHGLCLARCDFSMVRWSHVTVEDCDLSRCLLYRAELHHVTFVRCNFTGAILRGARCGASPIHFEECDFRLAAVGLTCANGGDGGGSSVRFVRCNFDLCDFQFSEGLNRASAFVQCSNTHLAAGFPLRVRGTAD